MKYFYYQSLFYVLLLSITIIYFAYEILDLQEKNALQKTQIEAKASYIDSLEANNLVVSMGIDSVLYYHRADCTYIKLYELRYERGLFQSTTPHLQHEN